MNIKNLSNQTIMILYALVVVLGIGLWAAISLAGRPNTINNEIVVNDLGGQELDDLLLNAGYTEEDIQNLDDEEKQDALLNSDNFRYGKTVQKLYSSASGASEFSNSEETYSQLLGHFASRRYDTVIDKVDSILSTHHLSSPQNMPIVDIFQDAYLMYNYENLDWVGKETVLKSMKNPEAFVLAVLEAYPRRRESVTFDIGSMGPMSTGNAAILKTTLLGKDSEEYKWNEQYMDDVRNVYRIDFSYGEYDEMHAYVLETNEKVLRLAGFYTDKEYEFIKPVSWWMSAVKDREKGE